MIFFAAILTTFAATALGASIVHKEINLGHRADVGKHQDSSAHWPQLDAGNTEHHYFKIVPPTEHLHHQDEEEKHHAVVIHIEVDTSHDSEEEHPGQHHDLEHHWKHEHSEEDHHNLEHGADSEEERDFGHHLYPGYHRLNDYYYPHYSFGGQLQHNAWDHQPHDYGQWYPSTGVHQYTGHYGDYPQDWTSHLAGYHGAPTQATKHWGLVHYPHTGDTYGINQQIEAKQREHIWHLLHPETFAPTHSTLDYTRGKSFTRPDDLHHSDDVHH